MFPSEPNAWPFFVWHGFSVGLERRIYFYTKDIESVFMLWSCICKFTQLDSEYKAGMHALTDCWTMYVLFVINTLYTTYSYIEEGRPRERMVKKASLF